MAEKCIGKNILGSPSSTHSKSSFDISNIKVSTVACICLFIFLLFENPLESVVPGLGYFDELLFIAMATISVIKCQIMHLHLGGEALAVGILSFLIVGLGLLGNLLTGFQPSAEAIIKEALAFLKFPLGTISALYLFAGVEFDEVISGCDFISKVFVLICVLFAVINCIIPSAGFGHGIRHGILSFKFIFSHPTFLVFSLVMAYVAMEAKTKGVTFFKIACLGILILTMRDKAFGFIGFVLAVWVFNMGSKKKLFPYLVLAGVVVLFVAWPKISEYISYSNSPRQALYTSALSISFSYFPFGGGLASIASSLSGEYYSNAYSYYGLSNMTGLTPFDYIDAGDAGFAYYLGQFGIIGFLLFLFILFLLYKVSVLRLPLGSPKRSSILYIFAYLVISLTVETSLTNATGIMAAILIAIICGGDALIFDNRQRS